MESEPSSAGILCGWSFSKSTRVYTQPHPSWRLSLLRRAQWPHGPTAQPEPQAALCSKARLGRVSGPCVVGAPAPPDRILPPGRALCTRWPPSPSSPVRLPRPFGPHVLTHSMALPTATRQGPAGQSAPRRWHYALASCVTGTPQRPQLCSGPARRRVHKRHADGSQPASRSHAGTRTSTCCTCTRAAHAPSDSPPCRPAPAQLLAPTSDTSAPPPQTCRQLRGDAPCLHDPNPAPLQDPGAWPLGKGLIVCLCF